MACIFQRFSARCRQVGLFTETIGITEKTYVYWAKHYVLYHNKRHPHNWRDVLTSDMAIGVR